MNVRAYRRGARAVPRPLLRASTVPCPTAPARWLVAISFVAISLVEIAVALFSMSAPSTVLARSDPGRPWWREPLDALLPGVAERALDGSAGRGPVLAAHDLGRELFLRVNKLRREKGRAPLDADDRLRDVALLHSRDMARKRYFSHQSRDGRGSGDRLALRYPEHVGAFAENIYRIRSYRAIKAPGAQGGARVSGRAGYSAATVADRIIAGWMGSPGHRDNLLREEMLRVGYGVVVTEEDIYVTQLFSRPVVILERALPKVLSAGSRTTVKLALGPDLVVTTEVAALIIWPDPTRRFILPDGRSIDGASPVESSRVGRRVTLTIDAPGERGEYRLRIGSDGLFYDIGAFSVR